MSLKISCLGNLNIQNFRTAENLPDHSNIRLNIRPHFPPQITRKIQKLEIPQTNSIHSEVSWGQKA